METGAKRFSAWVAAAVVVAVAAFVLWLVVDAPAMEWEPAQLSERSRLDDHCAREVEDGVAEVIAATGLSDVEMGNAELDALVRQGHVDQRIRLYGGDEIRHWTLAIFEEGPTCAVYNESVTAIDLESGRPQESATPRPIRGDRDSSALAALYHCECIGR